MNEDLKIIKKLYGEDFMHLCRKLFPTILEQPGLLSKLIQDKFAPSKFLYNDIIPFQEYFKNYIYSLVDVEKINQIDILKSPQELLDEAGYNLFECKNENDIQSFKKYYSPGEELCTFDGNRLDRCFVFFALKKNVEEIERKNFQFPNRQDEYGTSVISIQFTRGEINTLSIKNRYNHTVNNPDATFSNNLDNIIPGLSNSFSKYYNLNIDSEKYYNFELPGYVRANDGKLYKYNYEINNVYYCPNNIILDHFETKKYDTSRYLILDYFVLDLQEKTIDVYDESIKDTFVTGLKNIENISIQKSENDEKIIKIITKDDNEIIIILDQKNNIIKYKNNELTSIEKLNSDDKTEWKENTDLDIFSNVKLNEYDDYYELKKKYIAESYINGIKKMSGFLKYNTRLEEIYLPKVKKIENNFLLNNKELLKLYLPQLKEVGTNFLPDNNKIEILDLPQLETVGPNFLNSNYVFTEINLPQLQNVSDFRFLKFNDYGYYFLDHYHKLRKVNMDKLSNLEGDYLGNMMYEKLLYFSPPKFNVPFAVAMHDYFFFEKDMFQKRNLILEELRLMEKQEMEEIEDERISKGNRL